MKIYIIDMPTIFIHVYSMTFGTPNVIKKRTFTSFHTDIISSFIQREWKKKKNKKIKKLDSD